jgi:crotonobetainyl-CoA:carnitine CoA-transferase CaiB-like acyl-CoA transferase
MLRHGPAVQLSATPAVVAAGCEVGQHTRAILDELGYPPEQVDQLLTDGIVGEPSPVGAREP